MAINGDSIDCLSESSYSLTYDVGTFILACLRLFAFFFSRPLGLSINLLFEYRSNVLSIK